jgi:thioredoxin 1
MAVMHLTDSSFAKEVLSSDLPVLVDFWAVWCGPCKMIAPLIEEIAAEYAGKLKVGKVNVDDGSQTAGKYGIMSIPTLVFFKQGKIMGQVIGALSKAELKKRIEEII